MQLGHHVEELQRQLLIVAAAGDAQTQESAERLAAALDAAARIALLDALAEAAGEITRALAPGSVDLQLRGREVEFAVTTLVADRPDDDAAGAPARAADAAASATEGAVDDSSTSRTTLRLPDALKVRAEAAAARKGVSLNTWFVRAVSAALDPRVPVRESHGTSYAGWVR